MFRKVLSALVALSLLIANPCFAGSSLLRLDGPVLWNPRYDPNLVAWWDANSLSASPVASWTDKKSGIVASQGTTASQPTWSATARNGKPGVSVTGGQVLTFPSNSIPIGTATSAIYVAAFANSSGVYAGPFGYGGTPNSDSRGIQKSNANNADVSTYGTDLGGPSWANVDRFIAGFFSSATMSGFADGTSFGSISVAFNTSTSAGGIGLTGMVNPFSGVIQQIVVTNAVPSTSIRQKYEGWESWYDGKAGVNLPSGHPYKSRPPYVSDP